MSFGKPAAITLPDLVETIAHNRLEIVKAIREVAELLKKQNEILEDIRKQTR